MIEPLKGAAEKESAKAHVLDDGEIEKMRIQAEIDALIHSDEEDND